MTPEFEWQRPIIIIGAGRSGSTVLSTLIGEHPDVYAADETSFLLNRLWDEYFAKRDYVMNYRIWKLIRNTKPEWRDMSWYEFGTGPLREQVSGAGQTLIDAINEEEEERLSRSLGWFMADSLVPNKLRRQYWSFKEIWNGSPSFSYGWDRHDMAFPGARYVHLVRHPLTWLRSYFANLFVEQKEICKDDAIYALKSWVSMIECSRQQAKHKSRYIEIRYEDLKDNPEMWLCKLFSFLGLSEDQRCKGEFRYQYLPSKVNVLLPTLFDHEIESVPRLTELSAAYGYDLMSDYFVKNYQAKGASEGED